MPSIVPNQFPTSESLDGSRLAFVGEAPADQEIRQGLPFVGKAGKQLASWMQHLKILRSHCFIGNLSQERAPQDEIGNMFLDSKGNFPNERLQHWIAELRKDLERYRPNCIVALGRYPLQILTGKQGISKYWGSILPCTLVPGSKVVALYHPSAIDRGLHALIPLMVTWLRRAYEESKFRGLELPDRQYVLNPSFEETLSHLDRLSQSPKIAFDIERPKPKKGQLRTYISHISFADSPHWAMSIPLVTHGHHRWHLDREIDILRAVARILEGPALKIGHNLVFDFLSIIDEWKINIRPPYFCTQTAHNRCYPDLSDKRLKKLKLNSLAACTAIYTREPYYKEDYKSENEDSPTWKGSEEEFMLYNAKDSVVAFEIQEATSHDLKTFGQTELFKKDMEIFEPLGYMGLRGILRDRDRLAILQTEVADSIETLQSKIDELAGCHLNVGSTQQVSRVLYTQRGNRIQFDPKTKRPTTDEAAMAKLRRVSDDPLIPLIIQMRRFSKFDSTYAQAAISQDNRTRTTYNQTRTTTFRISSSDSVIGGGMNLQNIPSRPRPGEEAYNKWVKEFKQTFIADPGCLMARRDYIQAEAMVVAWMADDQGMINDFQTSVDIHCRTAEQLFNIPYSKIREGHIEGNPEMKMKRYFGKKSRHAFNYKMGKRRLKEEFWKEGVSIEERDCERMLQALASANPKTTFWWREVEDQLRATRTITTPWGRRRFFMGIITDDTVREAIAFGPQSTVADLLNMALRRIWQTIPSEIDLLLQIHDALVFQTPVDLIQQKAEKVGALMLIPIPIRERILTIPSDLAIGPSWGDLK